MFIEFMSLGDPSRRMFDDGVGNHVNRAKHMADMGRLS
jgi:hypothetical protein